MEQLEMLKGNRLIADFMNIPKCDRCDNCGKYKLGPGNYCSPEELKYHIDWGKLMPIIEKISRIKIDWKDAMYNDTYYPRTFGMLNVETGNPMVRLNANSVFEAPTLIEAAWLSVIDFLKLHGSQ